MDYEQARKYYNEGREFLMQGKWEEAARSLEAALDHCIHFKTLELLGECYLNLQRHSEAIVALGAAVSLNRSLRARVLIAEALAGYGATHLVPLAESYAKEVLATEPRNKRALAVIQKLQSNSGGES